MADNSSAPQNSAASQIKDKDRLRALRERQNEERLRKVKEIREQALQAQRVHEQKELERRKRMEELRTRDSDKRQQVEERKRQIEDAERERREAILMRNRERDAKIESRKRTDRHSMNVFAFGSSTPRLLEPTEASFSSFWINRRATSTANIMFSDQQSVLSRRSAERETDASGKKRATSASGLDRNPVEGDESDVSMTQSLILRNKTVVRRRTDLVPTIPLPRNSSYNLSHHSRTSSISMRSSDMKSGDVTPSRPGSAMSGASSVTKSAVVRRPASASHAQRKPRPASIAGTGMSIDQVKRSFNSNGDLKSSADDADKSMDRNRQRSKLDKDKHKSKSPSARSSTRATPLTSPMVESKEFDANDTPKRAIKVSRAEKNETESIKAVKATEIVKSENEKDTTHVSKEMDVSENAKDVSEPKEIKEKDNMEIKGTTIVSEEVKEAIVKETKTLNDTNDLDMVDLTASFSAKSRITTEEEAKAALAERRRLAREEAERQAELERQRVELEAQKEAERVRFEEEEQARLEEEALRLAQMQRVAEETRLKQAIEEANKREEEERLRKLEEERARLEKEETDRKMREEAEKQRILLQKKLEKEEKEREARRKRVEAIMSRTRGRGSVGPQNSGQGNESDNVTGSVNESQQVPSNGSTTTNYVGFNNSQFGNSDETQTSNGSDLNNALIETVADAITKKNTLSSITDQYIEQIPFKGKDLQHTFNNANEISSINVLTHEDSINSNNKKMPENISTDLL